VSPSRRNATFEEAGVATDDPDQTPESDATPYDLLHVSAGFSIPDDSALAGCKYAIQRISVALWRSTPRRRLAGQVSWWVRNFVGSEVFQNGVLRPALVVLLISSPEGCIWMDRDVCGRVYAGKSQADALRIMKDPHLGPWPW